MFDLDHWQEIAAALGKNRLRTFLTAFGVFWGIFLLVVLLGSGNGLNNGVMAGFSGTATNSLFVWGMRTSKPYAGMDAGRSIDFTNEDIGELRRLVPEAAVIAPRLQMGGWRGGATARRKGEVGSFTVMGDYPEIFTIQSMVLDRGRLLNRLDLDEKRKVAVIGTRAEETLFEKDENPIGDAIEINGVWFKVVGVFRSRQTGNQGERDAQTIYIPFTTYQQAFNAQNEVHWFAVTARDGVFGRRCRDQGARHPALAPQGGAGRPARHRLVQPREGVRQAAGALRRHPRPDVDRRRGNARGGRHRRLQHHADRRPRAHQGDRPAPRHRGDAVEGHGADRLRGGGADVRRRLPRPLGRRRPARGRRPPPAAGRRRRRPVDVHRSGRLFLRRRRSDLAPRFSPARSPASFRPGARWR